MRCSVLLDSEKVFGSDVFPPSIALLGGHLYAEWEAATDYLTGGSSFGGVVGWATTVTNLATEWAPALCQIVPGLHEGIALQTIYQMFEYGDLALPLSIAGIQGESLPLSEMYNREVTKLKALTSGKTPLYPPVSASGDPELVRQLCTAVVDHECDGAPVYAESGRGREPQGNSGGFRSITRLNNRWTIVVADTDKSLNSIPANFG